ncbi:MAG: ABC transporter ATP-binding protein [Catenibacillus sp.]|nr:ABC transporter ATP-binding protein [Catenibacillus sp.]
MGTLEIKNISYTYKGGTKPVINDVSCDFEKGKLYAVIGPSGSGKSTLLSLMAGLDKPSAGTIDLEGKNIFETDLDAYRRQSIAMIFQNFQLLPLLTVLENVCYVMEINGVKFKDAKGKASELLLSVGIEEEKHKRYPSNLSGGEQQRVAIARALASGTGIILADEPTGNLDVTNTENIMGILEGLAHEKQYCVIVVTHDLEIADRADKVYQMRDGVLIEKK